jgi:hypothetical protein
MAALDITENTTKMSLSFGGAKNISAGTGVKDISNGTPTPLDIGKPEQP